MTLDISSFDKAIAKLGEGLARYERETNDDQIRDGLIHRFEVTYERGLKMLRRYMDWASATPGDYDEMPFQDFIRSANEQGLLLGDLSDWRAYRNMRNITKQTHDESKALEVVTSIPIFLAEAVFMRDQMRRRLG